MSTSPVIPGPAATDAGVAILAEDVLLKDRLGRVLATASAPVVDHALADVLIFACHSFRSGEADEVRALVRDHPTAAILVVSRGEDAARVRHALEAGASGFVTTDDAAFALMPAVTVVAAGQISLPPVYRRQIAKPTFTTREKQILGLVVMGMSNGEIGRKLYLAESTVKSHLSSAFNKLGVRSRNEATALILDPTSGLGPGILRITEDLPGTRRLSLS